MNWNIVLIVGYFKNGKVWIIDLLENELFNFKRIFMKVNKVIGNIKVFFNFWKNF